jgi:hypothetical protein
MMATKQHIVSVLDGDVDWNEEPTQETLTAICGHFFEGQRGNRTTQLSVSDGLQKDILLRKEEKRVFEMQLKQEKQRLYEQDQRQKRHELEELLRLEKEQREEAQERHDLADWEHEQDVRHGFYDVDDHSDREDNDYENYYDQEEDESDMSRFDKAMDMCNGDYSLYVSRMNHRAILAQTQAQAQAQVHAQMQARAQAVRPAYA